MPAARQGLRRRSSAWPPGGQNRFRQLDRPARYILPTSPWWRSPSARSRNRGDLDKVQFVDPAACARGGCSPRLAEEGASLPDEAVHELPRDGVDLTFRPAAAGLGLGEPAGRGTPS